MSVKKFLTLWALQILGMSTTKIAVVVVADAVLAASEYETGNLSAGNFKKTADEIRRQSLILIVLTAKDTYASPLCERYRKFEIPLFILHW